ncbi:MAG: RDD family protein [Dongiaceae bacterium]
MTAAATLLATLEGERRRRRRLLPPEGVVLQVEVARASERAAAFAIDYALSTVGALLPLLAVALLSAVAPIGTLLAIALFFQFVVRNFYFLWFELRWGGATPGKRALGLRVIDREGGRLTAAAVATRNLLREAELFLPLAMLLGAGGGLPWWQAWAIGGWIVLFLVLPLLGPDRLRAGDLAAGTLVIAVPRRLLLDDIAQERRRFAFDETQLALYGEEELAVLDHVLRRPASHEGDRLRAEVCRRIRRRLGLEGELAPADAAAFLADFYTAQRARLERRRQAGQDRPADLPEAS